MVGIGHGIWVVKVGQAGIRYSLHVMGFTGQCRVWWDRGLGVGTGESGIWLLRR